jgi:predicted histidine transporter YuiF (NhaC family)
MEKTTQFYYLLLQLTVALALFITLGIGSLAETSRSILSIQLPMRVGIGLTLV